MSIELFVVGALEIKAIKIIDGRLEYMIHLNWEDRKTIKQIECVHANAKKFIIQHKLTPGKRYEVKNETDEFYFIIDNSNRIGGFLKDYFKEVE